MTARSGEDAHTTGDQLATLASTTFTFGIPLIARATAGDWDRVQALLGLCLRSLLAQRDPAFGIVVAGHDRPDCASADPRISFLRVD